MARKPNNNTNATFINGTRYGTPSVSLDEQARRKGYQSFADYQEQDPQGAEALVQTQGSGTIEQVAAQDDSSPYTKFGALLAGTAAAGGLGEFLAAGGAPAAAASGATTAAGTGATTAVPGVAGATAASGAAGASPLAGIGTPTFFASTTAPSIAGGIGAPSFLAAVPGVAGAIAANSTVNQPPDSADGSPADGYSEPTSLPGSDEVEVGTGGSGGGFSRLLGRGLSLAGPALANASNASASNTSVANNDDLEAAANDRANAQYELNSYGANTSAQSAFENELIGRANLEGTQRNTDLTNVYRNSVATSGRRSPFNPNPVTYSPQFLSTIGGLAQQGASELRKPRTFNSSTLPAPTFSPYVPRTLTTPTPRRPGGVGQGLGYVAPILSGIGALLGGGAR